MAEQDGPGAVVVDTGFGLFVPLRALRATGIEVRASAMLQDAAAGQAVLDAVRLSAKERRCVDVERT